MTGLLTFLYGVISYVVFFVTFLYAIGFVGNLVVPKSIDSGVDGPLLTAVIINVILLGVFAVQHSVMARPAFKHWWTKFVPQAMERSTYVLLTNVALILLYCFWQPMTGTIWYVENSVGSLLLSALFWLGWVLVLLSTFMINHFDLFGLRQVYLRLKGEEYTSIGFKAPWLYRHIRHPIMTGFIIAFWATPHMTTGHLLFAVATTLYILIALQLEERDLLHAFGDTYKDYRRQVSMLFPWKTTKRE